MPIKIITPPTTEPVTLGEIKAHTNWPVDEDDPLLNLYISAARAYAEKLTGGAFVTQTVEYVLDSWPSGDVIHLPKPPLQSVTSIKYYGADGTEYTMDPTDYIVDTDSFPGRISLAYGKTWPSITLQPVNGIRIRFAAGHPVYAGTVDTNGTAVTWKTGDKFNVNWPASYSITINNTLYSVASVTSTEALTLQKTAGEQEGAAYMISDVPLNIKQALFLLVALQYAVREPILIGRAGNMVNPLINTASADVLLTQDRAFWGEHWNDN